MLSPHQLHTLRTVLATGSYAAAAAELRYTPSAVSQQMTALERASGLQLFERSAHSIRPTPHAQLLAERAAEVLALLDGLDREVAAIARGEAGQLRIGSFPTASARLLPAALATLRRQRPGVEIEVDEGELAELLPRLLSGELDLALAYRYDTAPAGWPARLAETELLREPLSLLLPAGHRLADTGPVRLAALAAERWVAPLADSPGALNLDRLAARAGFSPRVSYRSNDYSVVRGLVAAGLGVALVPRLGLADTEGVLATPLQGRPPRRAVLALHRPAAGSSLIAAALEAIRATSSALA
ncbi:LysR substrate-binding domain-containing protein [Jatrophihabitans sp.]|uniref:LysR substrate-binding domain-containing protein n=1 Tax=Jatrophihabitans sp. TaxID=1932789 RepID=UPI002C4C0596|nr:LysR substrate-binding domain-containing protein [Jatrophihabitans sp.]